MEIDEQGRPQPTGRFETLEADALILALGQDTRHALLRKVAGVEFQEDGTVVVDPNMMTGHPGLFAGGDMVPSERTVTVAVGHGKKAARHIDAWLRGATLRQAAQARARELRQAPRLVLHRRRAAAAAGARRSPSGSPSFDEVVAGLERGRGAVRGAALPLLRQLLRVRRLLRRLPGARDRQARARQALPLRLRPVHRLRGLLRAVPVPRDRDDPGAVRMSIDVGATPATAARSGRLRPTARKVAMIDGNEAAASSPTASTRSARSTRSRRPRPWPSSPTSGRARAGPTSGATSRRRSRCRARAGAAGRGARRAPGGRADHDLHGVAGPAADDPQHVQDRGRADAARSSTSPRARSRRRRSRSSATTPTSWRPAPPASPSSASSSVQEAHDLALIAQAATLAGAHPVPPLLRRLPHLARDQQDRAARATTRSGR